MKKFLFTLVAVAFISIGAFSQKFAYVDTEYILENIPSYQMAQNQLDDLSIEWQKEIEVIFAEIDKMYKAYRAEEVLLPEDMKNKRQDAIISKEREVKELQKKRFGKDGDLFQKRQELVKPIQDKIYSAIEEVAKLSNLDVIFDISSNLSLLYTNSKYDKSDNVLSKLGYSIGGAK